MRLPNPERAVVELAKLSDYCLDMRHENGKHKARVFASALGLTQRDAGWLRDKLLKAVYGEAQRSANTGFGDLYMIDFRLTTSVGTATVRSGWIVLKAENFPRLTTCYVRK